MTAAAVGCLLWINASAAQLVADPLAGNHSDVDYGARHWVVQLVNPPLATYSQALPGLPLAPRLTDGRINLRSPQASAYLGYLAQRQDNFLNAAASTLGRPVSASYGYRHVFNGLTIKATKSELARLAALPQVKRVYPIIWQRLSSDTGPALIGAPQLWDGALSNGLGATQGEGVVVGVLDAGVNADHPSFAASDARGYRHINPLGFGRYLGYCIDQADFCNDKLIGAYDFVHALVAGNPAFAEEAAPEDNDGHGSHVSSIAVGNQTDVLFNGLTIPISGVAPRANLVSFDVCALLIETGQGLCPSAATLAAVDRAVADGVVSVLNFSVSGGGDPYNDAVSQAFLNATAAGIVVVAAAGNSGPEPATLSHHEPWVITVGAASHGREFVNSVAVVEPLPIPPNLQAIRALEGDGPGLVDVLEAPLLAASAVDSDNENGCTPLAAASFEAGIALVSRGQCDFATKVNHMAAAGALGVVIYDNAPGGPLRMVGLESTTIPALMVGQGDGAALLAFASANSTARARMHPLQRNTAGPVDLLADFSGRGPNSAFDVLKPNLIAPGVNVLAALASDGVLTPPEVGSISGTSMATPHVAGAAALLKALKPSLSPAEIQSALMLSADTAGNLKQDGVSAADPFDQGSGRVDVAAAARGGLIMDETVSAFAAADPATGGDPGGLNLAALMHAHCFPTCTFTRTVSNATVGTLSWRTQTQADNGVQLSVSPERFTLGLGRSVSLTITVDTSLAPIGQWTFAQAILVPESADYSDSVIDVAVRPIHQSADDAASFSKTAAAAVGPLQRLTYQFDLTNMRFAGAFDFSDQLPPQAQFVAGSGVVSLTNGTETTPLTHVNGRVTWRGSLGLPQFSFDPQPAPLGYVNLAALGVPPQACTAQCDDTFISFVDLPVFSFNGQQFDSLVVSSNGFVVLGKDSSEAFSPVPQNLPDTLLPNRVVAPFWTDLDLLGSGLGDSGHGTLYAATVTSGAEQAIVVEWADVERFGAPGIRYRFQLQIYPDSAVSPGIYLNYAQVPATDFALGVGAESGNGSAGLAHYYHDGVSGTGSPPRAGDQLSLTVSQSGQANIRFDVRTPATAAVLINTAQIADADLTLQAQVVTAVSPLLDTVFADGFE